MSRNASTRGALIAQAHRIYVRSPLSAPAIVRYVGFVCEHSGITIWATAGHYADPLEALAQARDYIACLDARENAEAQAEQDAIIDASLQVRQHEQDKKERAAIAARHLAHKVSEAAPKPYNVSVVYRLTGTLLTSTLYLKRQGDAFDAMARKVRSAYGWASKDLRLVMVDPMPMGA